MYEYKLYTQIPSSRHNQVLQILAGITAMQPVPFREQVLIYQQLKLATVPGSKKGQVKTQVQQKLNHHKIVRDLDAEDNAGDWRLRIEQVPDSGIKNVISQPVSERALNKGELDRFREGSEWYKYVGQYTVAGCRFVSNNVVTLVHRPLVSTTPPATDPLSTGSHSQDDLEPMDPSGIYVVEAYVAAEDGISTELREKGVNELLRFAKEVEGVVDLRVPARLALDPSVKGI